MSNFKTAMRLTSINMALEFVQHSDINDISFKSGEDLTDFADTIYSYITQDIVEDKDQPEFELVSLKDFH